MNINNINRGFAVYQNSLPTKPAAQSKKPVSRGNDTMTLSDTARDFRVASDAVKNSPEVRYDKVAKLKEQFASDNYKINFEEISEKILKSNYDAIVF